MIRELTEHAAAAKAIRQELKATFPTVAFKVRSSSFAGGDAVDVHWTDGPTSKQVESLIDKYQYGHFDGMIDLYEYSNTRKDIPQAKYVHAKRGRSLAALSAIVDQINREWGTALIVVDSPYDPYIDRASDQRLGNNGGWYSDMIHRMFSALSLVCADCAAATMPGDCFCPSCGKGLEVCCDY